MKNINQKNGIRSKFTKIFWLLFTFGFIFVVFIFVFISIGWIGYLPPIDELQNPKNKYATEIYTSDMQVLGHYYYNKDNRVGVHYSEISENVVNALIATEDVRYYDHSGIDGKALIRAIIFTGILQHSSSGGGSTITQQLAKQLYSPQADNIIERALQKPIEWVISVKLERLYTKEEIMAMYLNQIDFLNNAVGIKSPSKLKIEEAATLVGMCKNPSYFNPVRYKERTLNRRNVVLNQMRKADFITDQQYDSLKVLPLTLHYQKVDHKLGLAAYFREYLRMMLTATEPNRSDYGSWQQGKYEEDRLAWDTNPLYGFCNKNKKTDGTPYNIYSDGLKIYTTIDSRMQQYAEDAVDEHIHGLQKTFFKEKRNRSYAPFARNVNKEEIDGIMQRSMKQSERYLKMKAAGISDSEIEETFKKKIEMLVFSYNGDIDTILSPLDSIRYHKYYLRCGF